MREFLEYSKELSIQYFRDQFAIFRAIRNWIRRNAEEDTN
jgi:hypothetical protein